MNQSHAGFLRTLAVIAMCLVGSVQAADPHQMVLDGRARTPDGERNAQLLVECRPDSKGSLALQMVVPEAYPTKQRFDFEAFEGPDPAAGRAKLTLLSVSGASGRHELRTDVGGWYSAEVEGAFVFATNQYTQFRKDIADLVSAMARGESTFNWTQEGFADHGLKIEASFAIDAAASQRIGGLVTGCVAKAKKR